jgi:hypothetical protein
MPINLRTALAELTRTRVLVGVPSDSEPHLGADPGANRRQQKPDAKHQITNAELAYIHSNGAPEVNIPARPFLAPGLGDVQREVSDRLMAAARAGLAGDVGIVDETFDAVGLIVQSAARRRIVEGIPPPLKPGTVAARRRRSKGSRYRRKATAAEQRAFNLAYEMANMFGANASMEGSPTTPLYDTGQLLRSITYVKRKTS